MAWEKDSTMGLMSDVEVGIRVSRELEQTFFSLRLFIVLFTIHLVLTANQHSQTTTTGSTRSKKLKPKLYTNTAPKSELHKDGKLQPDREQC